MKKGDKVKLKRGMYKYGDGRRRATLETTVNDDGGWRLSKSLDANNEHAFFWNEEGLEKVEDC